VHNQLSAPRFENLFKYSWYACGFNDTHPGPFDNPVEFRFNISSIGNGEANFPPF
jgi:hypothetical protein